MKNFKSIAKPLSWFMAFLMIAFVVGCNGVNILGSGSASMGNSAKAITAYSLSWTAGSATATINESTKTIAVTVPYNTPLTALIATFTTTGTGVKVGTTTQISGTTSNTFISSPVVYVVTATDGSTASYNVIVTVALKTDKAITAFSLLGYSGVISEVAKTIAVTLPAGTTATTIKSLIATFTTTGTGVVVGTAGQTSGKTPNDFTSPVVYIVSDANASTASYTVTVTVASVTAKAITAYSLAGVAGVITPPAGTTHGTIAVALPSGTSTIQIATFTSTGQGNPTVLGVPQISNTTSNSFAGIVTYIVTAADNSTATYDVTVTVASTASKAITAYSLGGISGIITGLNISVTMPTGTDVTNLVALFTSTGQGLPTVAGVKQISGTTSNNFTSSKAYLVTAQDASTATYTVTVAFAVPNPTAPTLGEAGRFLILASQAITNVPTSALSNGDLGIMDQARSYYTGFTNGATAGQFTELTGGMSYAPDDLCPAPYACPLHYSTPVVGATWTSAGAMITQVRTDLTTAYNFLAAGTNPTSPVTTLASNELGGLTLVRGVYSSAVDLLISTPLHLDAQGDPSAVFIITTAGKITNGVTGNIVLDNGAQARNIYWRSAGITTIAAGTTFYGSIFADTQVNVLSGAIITGSLFAVTDQVTLISDAVTKAP